MIVAPVRLFVLGNGSGLSLPEEVGEHPLGQIDPQQEEAQHQYERQELATLVGLAVARAPTMAGKRLFARFAAILTSDENTYFERCFDSVGIAPADRAGPVLWPESWQFLQLHVPPDRVYVSLERNMNCGFGRCGHCQYGPHFICRDGPVFRFDDIAPFFGKGEV